MCVCVCGVWCVCVVCVCVCVPQAILTATLHVVVCEVGVAIQYPEGAIWSRGMCLLDAKVSEAEHF